MSAYVTAFWKTTDTIGTALAALLLGSCLFGSFYLIVQGFNRLDRMLGIKPHTSFAEACQWSLFCSTVRWAWRLLRDIQQKHPAVD